MGGGCGGLAGGEDFSLVSMGLDFFLISWELFLGRVLVYCVVKFWYCG